MQLSTEAKDFLQELLQESYTNARMMSDQDEQEKICTICDELSITVYKN